MLSVLIIFLKTYFSFSRNFKFPSPSYGRGKGTSVMKFRFCFERWTIDFNLDIAACSFVLVIFFVIFRLFEYLCEFCVHSAIKVLKVFICLVKSLWQLVMSVVLCQNLGITVMFSTMFCDAIDHQSKCWFSS